MTPTAPESATATETATATGATEDGGNRDATPEFRRFVRRIDERTAVSVEGEYVNESLVRLHVPEDIGNREFNATEGIFPVPQATAYVIADARKERDVMAPERVQFDVYYQDQKAQSFRLDRSVAVGFANLSVTNGEFRRHLHSSVTNTSADPGTQLLRYVSLERRRDTRIRSARAIQNDIESGLAEVIGPENVGDNITDVGIYREPVTLSYRGQEETIPPGKTMYIEFRIPRDGGRALYGRAGRFAISLNQTLISWANFVKNKPYEKPAANLRIRFIDLNNETYMTIDVPKYFAENYNSGEWRFVSYFLEIANNFVKFHNGGV